MGKKYGISGRHLRRKSRKHSGQKPSVNKYAHLVLKRELSYNLANKTYRDLPVLGKPGEVVRVGLRQIFHGRVYELIEDVLIPSISTVPGLLNGHSTAIGRHKLVMWIK